MANRSTPWENRTEPARRVIDTQRVKNARGRAARAEGRRKPSTPLGHAVEDTEFGADTPQVTVIEHQFRRAGTLFAPTVLCGSVSGEVTVNVRWNDEVILSDPLTSGPRMLEKQVPVNAGDRVIITLDSQTGAFKQTSFTAFFQES